MWFRRRKTDTIVEATEALEDAKKNLQEIKQRSGEVSRVSNALRDFRERNHFAEQLEAIILHPKRSAR